jgi:molybdopterin-guanine dinucleotide biosynthesis protein A
MGRDKALLELDGLPLVTHAIHKLEPLCDSVWICGNNPQLAAWGRLIPDAAVGAGPLAALVSATTDAAEAGAFFAIVLPVDVPLLPTDVMERLAMRAIGSGIWATLIEAGGHVQPLCAVYRGEIAVPLRELLESGERKVQHAVDQACDGSRMDCISLAELYGVAEDGGEGLPDGSDNWFLNVNTPAEWERAEELLRLRRMP